MPQGSRVRETEGYIAAEIEKELRRNSRELARVADEVEDTAETVRDYWRAISPRDEGGYIASIHVEHRAPIKGIPRRAVVADNYKAHWIEFGTGDPAPTPEFAPAAKTAAHFGGTTGDTGSEIRA